MGIKNADNVVFDNAVRLAAQETVKNIATQGVQTQINNEAIAKAHFGNSESTHENPTISSTGLIKFPANLITQATIFFSFLSFKWFPSEFE